MVPHFYHHPGILDYNFGPQHPLKPERLRRTHELLHRLATVDLRIAEPAGIEDLTRVHSPEYVAAVEQVSAGDPDPDLRARHGFYGDNPPFAGMWEASCAYMGATLAAARAVRDGAPLAFGIGGGLHHAHHDRASGFCIFDDPAAAVHVLRERFDRVAYIDIDVHHGDGVQWIWFDDPTVLTASIHESGRTLFPGTGFPHERGANGTSVNIPVPAKCGPESWLHGFEFGILPMVERFAPQAIVLQLGTDTHYLDPLGHVRSDQQTWLAAVRRVRDLGLPIVAVGGGGYNLTTVPRMWVSAILELSRIEYEDRLPEDLAAEWGVPTFSDPDSPTDAGLLEVDAAINELLML